ncbi:MAG: family 43 glycosylhydrolase [Segetibacter sp.]
MKRLLVIFLSVIYLSSTAQQLVLPGDYPDPSVIKIGDTYWASATTSNWFPAYPLLHSKDLVHWEQKGYVFSKLPDWADYYFWAPEISYENGKVYIYYAAHKKGGNLCVGIASADKPEGPYKDHGPLICQEVGSIDAFPMRDENGKLHLIWKEDANSVRKPTPIWIQPLNEERTALTGEKKELFRNTEPWEKNLVEGVSMIKHGEYFYAFYAAAGCCGSGCSYQSGVARSKSLSGPWEKYSKNPIMTNTQNWICPGHGTPIEKDGKYYFLYHGYDKESNAFTGRQGLLSEFTFTADNWIEVNKNEQGNNAANNVTSTIEDEFKGRKLSQNWQWSVFKNPGYDLKKKNLQLTANSSASGSYLGQKILWPNYTATTAILTKGRDAIAGLGAIGDDENTLSVVLSEDRISVIQLKRNKDTTLLEKSIDRSKRVYLRMTVEGGKDYTFLYSTDGKNFQALNDKPVSGMYLPPWDRAVRAGLISKGNNNQYATFDWFRLEGK